MLTLEIFQIERIIWRRDETKRKQKLLQLQRGKNLAQPSWQRRTILIANRST
jgi:hypothetical protein